MLLLSQASDALKALLRTASDPVEVPKDVSVAAEAESEDLAADEETAAAVLEMEEDNGHVTPAAAASRGRARGDRRRVRVNVRGRGQQRQRTRVEAEQAEAGAETPRQTVASRDRDRFRSFPARQSTGGRANIGGRPEGADPRTRSRVVTPRPQQSQQTAEAVTETTRFETRPTVAAPAPAESSTQARILDFQVFDDFEGFTFPTPVRAPPTAAPAAPRATELPRSQPQPAQVQSQFSLQQNFAATQPQPQPQSQSQAQFQPQPQAQFQPQPQLQPQTQAQFQPQQPRVQAVQPAGNRFQAQAAPQAAQSAVAPAFNPSFNLLNPSNFGAFDAQFGGSVTPSGAQQQSSAAAGASGIFSTAGSALLQGRDVILNPFSAQQPSVFGQQQQARPAQPQQQQRIQPFVAFNNQQLQSFQG